MSQTDIGKALVAEGRSQETRSFVHTVKAATRRKYTPEEKIRIARRRFRRCCRSWGSRSTRSASSPTPIDDGIVQWRMISLWPALLPSSEGSSLRVRVGGLPIGGHRRGRGRRRRGGHQRAHRLAPPVLRAACWRTVHRERSRPDPSRCNRAGIQHGPGPPSMRARPALRRHPDGRAGTGRMVRVRCVITAPTVLQRHHPFESSQYSTLRCTTSNWNPSMTGRI